MTPMYMPFTYISPAIADLLAALAGPVVVYQPMTPPVHDKLTMLADQRKIQLRTPIDHDTDLLRKTLSDFFQWVRLNPGKSVAGAEFFTARKEETPFFDETAISRIRADIKNYGNPEAAAPPDPSFSARLFLAVAQENDLTVDALKTDMDRIKNLEQGLLDVLEDADTDDFQRHGIRTETWPEDAGARQTLQRIRAWAMVAAADEAPPDLWVTTSPAVIDALMEYDPDAIGLTSLATIRLKMPDKEMWPLLEPVLAELASRRDLLSSPPDAFMALGDAAEDANLSVTLLAAVNHDPQTVIRALMSSGKKSASPAPQNDRPMAHTLILLVRLLPEA